MSPGLGVGCTRGSRDPRGPAAWVLPGFQGSHLSLERVPPGTGTMRGGPCGGICDMRQRSQRVQLSGSKLFFVTLSFQRRSVQVYFSSWGAVGVASARAKSLLRLVGRLASPLLPLGAVPCKARARRQATWVRVPGVPFPCSAAPGVGLFLSGLDFVICHRGVLWLISEPGNPAV